VGGRGRGPSGWYGRGWGQGGEMTQALYEHTNTKTIKKKEMNTQNLLGTGSVLSALCSSSLSLGIMFKIPSGCLNQQIVTNPTYTIFPKYVPKKLTSMTYWRLCNLIKNFFFFLCYLRIFTFVLWLLFGISKWPTSLLSYIGAIIK
jgi:hypothetical protein